MVVDFGLTQSFNPPFTLEYLMEKHEVVIGTQVPAVTFQTGPKGLSAPAYGGSRKGSWHATILPQRPWMPKIGVPYAVRLVRQIGTPRREDCGVWLVEPVDAVSAEASHDASVQVAAAKVSAADAYRAWMTAAEAAGIDRGFASTMNPPQSGGAAAASAAYKELVTATKVAVAHVSGPYAAALRDYCVAHEKYKAARNAAVAAVVEIQGQEVSWSQNSNQSVIIGWRTGVVSGTVSSSDEMGTRDASYEVRVRVESPIPEGSVLEACARAHYQGLTDLRVAAEAAHPGKVDTAETERAIRTVVESSPHPWVQENKEEMVRVFVFRLSTF